MSNYLEEFDHAIRMMAAKVTFMETKHDTRHRETQQVFTRIAKTTDDLDRQERSNRQTITECASALNDAVALGFPSYPT